MNPQSASLNASSAFASAPPRESSSTETTSLRPMKGVSTEMTTKCRSPSWQVSTMASPSPSGGVYSTVCDFFVTALQLQICSLVQMADRSADFYNEMRLFGDHGQDPLAGF